MALSNMKVFSKEIFDKAAIKVKRKAFLFNCATGNPTDNEKLAADYINELNDKIDQLYKRINGVSDELITTALTGGGGGGADYFGSSVGDFSGCGGVGCKGVSDE